MKITGHRIPETGRYRKQPMTNDQPDDAGDARDTVEVLADALPTNVLVSRIRVANRHIAALTAAGYEIHRAAPAAEAGMDRRRAVAAAIHKHWIGASPGSICQDAWDIADIAIAAASSEPTKSPLMAAVERFCAAWNRTNGQNTKPELDGLIEQLQAGRFAQTKSMRASGTGVALQAKSTLPAALDSAKTTCGGQALAQAVEGPSKPWRAPLRHDVRRAIVAREGHRCSFVGIDGQRCAGRAFLQCQHQRAWALGGADTTENLSLMCRAHNRLLAERELGTERVAQSIERARNRR